VLLASVSAAHANADLPKRLEVTEAQVNSFNSALASETGFKSNNYYPLIAFVISNSVPEKYVQDEKYGRVYPCSLYGAYKSLSNVESVYYYDDYTQRYVNSASQRLSAKYEPQGGESVNVYCDEKLIGEGKLVQIDMYGYTTYGICLSDQTLELEPGNYVAVNGQWNAVPRPITQLDELGSLLVDLNDEKKMIQLTLSVVDLVECSPSLNLYLDVYDDYKKNSILIGDGDEETLSDPEARSYAYVYDLDNDDNMEIVVFKNMPGGSGFEIYKVIKGVPTFIFSMTSE